MNSECFTPMVKAGALGLLTATISGLCAPGPGFFVASIKIGTGQ